jgi:hypothetical protein
MAKVQSATNHVSKSKKRGKHSKSASSNKQSKNYVKANVGQGKV